MSNPDASATSAESPKTPEKLAIFTGYPAAVVVAILYIWMAVSATTHQCVTFDEIAHIVSGYSYWSQNDYRLQPENGLLPQRWAGIPLQFGGVKFLDTQTDAGWLNSDSFKAGETFFYHLGNDVDSILLRSRAMIAILGAATAMIVYAWSRHLFGRAAGMLAIILFSFSPNVLAHGSLATSDMAATLFFLASTGSVWILLHRINLGAILLAAVSLAGLALSKYSAPIMFFIIAMMLVVRIRAGRPLFIGSYKKIETRFALAVAICSAGLATFLIAGIAIWVAYGFRYQSFNHFTPGRDVLHDQFETLYTDMTGTTKSAVSFAREHKLLPEAYLLGFSYVEANSTSRRAFLAGEYNSTGWKMFFPYAFLIKTPLPFFGVALLAIFWAIRCFRRKEFAAEYGMVPLFSLLIVYWLAAIQAHLNIGDRHILPIYPPTIILISAAANWLGRSRVLGGILAALVAWFAVESILIRPHYLAYFNQLVGGPKHGYQYLVDSSLDWGQDLPGFKTWLQRNVDSASPRPKVYFSYFGTGLTTYYKIDDVILLPSNTYNNPPHVPEFEPGIYCISATMLQSLYTNAWGPWNSKYETEYQALRKERKAWNAATPQEREEILKKSGDASEARHFKYYNELRFNRLCAYLRTREPDDNVNYTILIFKLTDDDLRKALDEPVPSMLITR